jgi:hypothetical protein
MFTPKIHRLMVGGGGPVAESAQILRKGQPVTYRLTFSCIYWRRLIYVYFNGRKNVEVDIFWIEISSFRLSK